ncbi:alpha/beta hydrolase [Dolichospermum sp. LEGE 00240]|jgi:phospholipase/carboxylesterase|uniref:alpha/beta hydrolase n=1 Tax=Dolichospermum sp. LEGE 00240 TaxID=1828603 RepID=UPI00187EFE06|nr:alpha/beta hydrolase [Dolichospermum sp. LEGE 00240]MDM3848311.1 alpha/beta hydrolase [Aphanizomenon gracile PMC638.10]MDM3849877.1 alpha/beta hydrolase [Aphanizomenon gracile PMC627.10]MDM3855645.1 alpha/beta hydrolase [Aphanizomenon gracile PMC649.10]MDM3861908.1 alpha/beta hydrolase [Aphanizomenon gracile PMC644.10]MBE9250923.1 alpha/beta hydrolase [Dolichospermum sp. LEGE 00240]
MTQTLDFIRVSPPAGKTPDALIVTLHGWGANAQDVVSLIPYVNLPDYEFLLPNAPYPYPYADTGKAWYDLRTEHKYDGLNESKQLLIDWLLSLESNTGVPLSRTILSGFSQGGAMTLDVGLTLPLAGLVVISGYLHPTVATLNQGNFPPTLIMHGTRDEVVPLQAAIKSREMAQSLGVAVEYHEFATGHEINLQMLEVLRTFVLNTIG